MRPVIIDQLERAFMVIGDKVMMAGGGHKNFDDFEVSEDNVTSELVISPRPLAFTPTPETRRSLNNVTKKEICDLASERFGVDLNFRTEKKELITQFLNAQEE